MATINHHLRPICCIIPIANELLPASWLAGNRLARPEIRRASSSSLLISPTSPPASHLLAWTHFSEFTAPGQVPRWVQYWFLPFGDCSFGPAVQRPLGTAREIDRPLGK